MSYFTGLETGVVRFNVDAFTVKLEERYLEKSKLLLSICNQNDEKDLEAFSAASRILVGAPMLLKALETAGEALLRSFPERRAALGTVKEAYKQATGWEFVAGENLVAPAEHATRTCLDCGAIMVRNHVLVGGVSSTRLSPFLCMNCGGEVILGHETRVR